MSRLETILSIINIPIDFMVVVAAFLISYYLRLSPDLLPGMMPATGFIPSWEEYLKFVVIAAFFLVCIFMVQGLYRIKLRRRFFRDVPHVIYGVMIWILLLMAWFFLTREFFFSRFVLLVSFGLVIVFTIFSRVLLRLVRRLLLWYGYGLRNILIVGASNVSWKICNALIQNKGVRIATVAVLKGHDIYKDYDKILIREVGDIDEIKDIIEKGEIDEIIQTDDKLNQYEETELLEYCHSLHKSFRFTPNLYHQHMSNIETSSIGDMPVIELKITALDGWGKVLKRMFDIVLSTVGLIILLPAFIVVGMLVKADSKGPMFVRLKRINKGNPFQLYKFRSMVDGAAKLKEELLKKNERGDGPLFKMKNDPRITRLGKFLRKTRLDEMPQLLNVLKGDMSLVGPRPHEPGEVAKYKKHHKKILAITPGMTGMGQVKGASDLDFEEEVKVDTYYVENWSLWLDVEILLKTIWVVLAGKGAS